MTTNKKGKMKLKKSLGAVDESADGLEMLSLDKTELTDDIDEKNLGIYIHVPFCKKKCNYCAFYSKGGGLSHEDEQLYVRHVDDWLKEGLKYSENQGFKVNSIFFGGGTPSLLSPSSIVRILDSINRFIYISQDCEITMEANPSTAFETGSNRNDCFNNDAEDDFRIRMGKYRNAGVNRLSIGCQTFDKKMLQRLGRIHDSYQVIKDVEHARNAGFDNISLDMMMALPNQTLDDLESDLNLVEKLQPDHISYYSLQIEEGTAFYKAYAEDKLYIPSGEEEEEMYYLVHDKLKAFGYRQYEISNYAKIGKESRHNLKYWTYQQFLGVGPTASSFIDGKRFKQELDGSLSYEKFTLADEAGIFVFTGLRMTVGVDLFLFEKIFGKPVEQFFLPVWHQVEEEIAKGNLEIDRKKGRMRLTNRGIYKSNDVMCLFV